MNNDSEEPDTSSGEMERAAWVSLEELPNYKFTSEVMLNACKEALQLESGSGS